MIRRQIIKLTVRYTPQKKQLINDAVRATIIKKGIVISRAKTSKEIFETSNYNRSIEIPTCGSGKL